MRSSIHSILGKKQSSKHHRQGRRLAVESLEERALLAVTVSELNAIYPDLNLSSNASDYNIIEITDLTEANIRAAIATAAGTTKNDLIVLQNNGKTVIDFGNESLKIDMDSEICGSITIVSAGTGILQLQSSADTGVVQIAGGNVALGGIVLCGVENEQAETGSVFDLIQTDTGADVRTSRIIRVVENSYGPGNFTVFSDEAASSVPSGSAGTQIGTKSYSITFGVGGTLEAYLTGITQTEKDAILAGSMSFLDTVVPYDAEKSGIGDSQLCWAGSTANMLAYTGWGNINGFMTEDDILDYFRTNFTDEAGNPYYANQWFITGDYSALGWSGWAQPTTSNSGGFYRDSSYLYNNSYSSIASYYNINGAGGITNAINQLKAGSAVGLTIGWYDSSHVRTGGHIITMWGAVYDTAKSPTDNGYYVSLLISDSDDDYGGGVNAPNLLKNYSIEWAETYDSYRFTSWTTGYLEGFTRLTQHPNPVSLQESPSTTVTTLLDVVDEYDGLISLREAIQYAGTNDLGTTITFDASLFGKTITLNGNELYIDKNITIAGSGANVTIDADQQSRVFNIAEGSTVELAGLTITGGYVSGTAHGGGILSSGMLTISDCTISGNSATSDGGGICCNSGTLEVTNCIFTYNSATSAGGGIISFQGTITVTDSTFANNSAYLGGGIFCNSGTLTVANSTITNNSAINSGGGIANGLYSTLTVMDCTITNNTASSDSGGGISNSGISMVTNCIITYNSADFGGGIYNSSTMTVMNSTIEDNSAVFGSGIYNLSGILEVANCIIVNNSTSVSSSYGGGIYNGNGTTTVTNSTIENNSASNSGGGIYSIGANSILEVADSTIANNSADSGGGICIYVGTMTVANSTIANNSADSGGGICDWDGTMTVINSTIANNSADYGGGIFCVGTLTLMNSIIANNSANTSFLSYGGGIHNIGNLAVMNTTIANNSASSSLSYPSYGGGIYNRGTLTVTNSTIANNTADYGGGIENDGKDVTLHNTIVALNSSDIDNTGQIQGSNNLTSFTGWTSGSNNLFYNPNLPLFVDPEKSDYRLQANSPAINAGSNALAVDANGNLLTDDLAGNERIQDRVVDMGAFEYYSNFHESVVEFVVTTLYDENDPILYAGDGISLREAVRLAQQYQGESVITFDAALFADGPQTVFLESTIVADSTTMTIVGPDVGLLTVIAPRGTDARIFEFTECVVHLSAMTLSGNTDYDYYWRTGGIYAERSELVLGRMAIIDSRAHAGAAVEAVQSKLTITNSELKRNNSLSSNIFLDGSVVFCSEAVETIIANCLISNEGLTTNTYYALKGIFQTEGTLTVADSTISHINGVGILFNGSGVDSLVVHNSTISNNDGGGIAASGPENIDAVLQVSVTDCMITDNVDTQYNYNDPHGVSVNGLIDIKNSTISGHEGRGLYVRGGLAMSDTTVSGNNTGGIYLEGMFGYESMISQCTISDNQVMDWTSYIGNGAGIFSQRANLTILDSVIRNNQTGHDDGGALFILSGNTTIVGTLIVGNSATNGGGIYADGMPQTLNIINSTITENHAQIYGGGIFSFYPGIVMQNSIVARNTGHLDIYGLADCSFSLIGVTMSPRIVHGENGNIVGTPDNPVDPLFVDPESGDYRLQANSPAINAGSNALAVDANGNLLTYDLAGNERIQDGVVDMGAYESSATAIVVSTRMDENDGVHTPGNLSLREAIELAKSMENAVIAFDPSLFVDGKLLLVIESELPVTTSLTIRGNGVTIDAQNQSRIFNITGTSKNVIDVTIDGLTLIGGYSKTYGGAVYATYADTTWNAVTFIGNAAAYGGAVYQKTGNATFSAVTFTSNTATYGGAFYLAAGNAVVMNNSRFEGNAATYGGAVYSKGKLDVMDTIFTANTAIWGGGVYLAGGNATLTDTTFSDNQAAAKSGTAIAKTAKAQLTVVKNGKTIHDTALAKYLDDDLL